MEKMTVKIRVENATAEDVAEAARDVDGLLDRVAPVPAEGLRGRGATQAGARYSYTVTPVDGAAQAGETVGAVQTSKAAIVQAASEAFAAALRLRVMCEREGRVGWVSDLLGPTRTIERVRDLAEQLDDERAKAPAQLGHDFTARVGELEAGGEFIEAELVRVEEVSHG